MQDFLNFLYQYGAVDMSPILRRAGSGNYTAEDLIALEQHRDVYDANLGVADTESQRALYTKLVTAIDKLLDTWYYPNSLAVQLASIESTIFNKLILVSIGRVIKGQMTIRVDETQILTQVYIRETDDMSPNQLAFQYKAHELKDYLPNDPIFRPYTFIILDALVSRFPEYDIVEYEANGFELFRE